MHGQGIQTSVIVLTLVGFQIAPIIWAQREIDPGPDRGPDYRLGRALVNLSPAEYELFEAGKRRFMQHYGVKGIPQANLLPGLGLRFNLDNCVGCHSQPEVGGSSPAENPQYKIATALGARNSTPYLVRANGPTLAAFSRITGRVLPLFTATGRLDVPPTCRVEQHECFTRNQNCEELAWRTSPPLYGLGLLESIPEATILENATRDAARKRQLGIHGVVNRDSSGRLTRFGWKAQTRTLKDFVIEAFQGEIGGINHTADRLTPSDCRTQGSDPIGLDAQAPAVIDEVTQYVRLLAPPPAPGTADSHPGRLLFERIGCGQCHTPRLTVAHGPPVDQTFVTVTLFSDLLIHRMGEQLADGLTQGRAGSDSFRTPPLWGLRHRIFLMHDGRATDLESAIEAHTNVRQKSTSEAEIVIDAYNALTIDEKRNLILFLRSL